MQIHSPSGRIERQRGEGPKRHMRADLLMNPSETQSTKPALDVEYLAIHEWQQDVPGFGQAGQQRLQEATVLVSRIGGLGGAVVWDLATAGVGRLILAHAGKPKPSDFNRQTLMRYDCQNVLRVEQAAQRLREFKPQ